MSVRPALKLGCAAVARNWGLVVLLLLVNVLVAGALAVPLSYQMDTELQNKGAAGSMMHGFDYNWWSEWHDRQHGWPATFAPDVFGIGFAFRNLDLLLKGARPARPSRRVARHSRRRCWAGRRARTPLSIRSCWSWACSISCCRCS